MSRLMFLAILPGILIVIYIFRCDKVEKEPVGLILRMVLLGAVSCAPAAFLEQQMDAILPSFQMGSFQYALTTAFLSAGLIEELCKFFFLKVGIWNNREFDYRFDGIVYGVSTAIGFACLENIMYVMEGGISVAVTRAFLSVPLHAFCGVFMGAYFGKAKQADVRGEKSRSKALMTRGVVTAVLIHGTYDTFAMWNMEYSYILLLVFTALVYIFGIRRIHEFAADDYNMGFYSVGESYEFVPSYKSPTLKSTNKASIAALVCAIISAITAGVLMLPNILAVVFGIIGIKNSAPGEKNTAAKAAIIIGLIFLLGGGYFIGMY